jgi:hypothetical protein
MSWACSTYGERGEIGTGFCCGNLKGKRKLGRPRNRWKDNIKVNLQEVLCIGTALLIVPDTTGP